MSDLVESYAGAAILRWARHGGRISHNAPHCPTHCPCLVCADGRAALDAPALLPLFARIASERLHALGVAS